MLNKIRKTASLIRSKMGITELEYGIVLGSGLGDLVSKMNIISTLDYSSIDDFPHSTVVGHQGRFVYGTLSGKSVLAMQGRVHYYEGYTMEQVVLPVRAMCSMGIHTLIVSNAAGGVNPEFRIGDVMLIRDQINMLPNPLIGKNIDEFGVRFPDMTTAYDRSLIALAHSIDDNLREGVYLGSSGPSYETQAEYRFFRTIGADACGMSTTPEVIVASHHGVRVFGISLISNVGIKDSLDKTTHEEVFEAASSATPRMTRLVEQIIATSHLKSK